MTNEEFERFREYSTERMARFFSALEETRQEARLQAEEDRRRNDQEHRQFRAELRAAVREGIRYVRETRREIQALIDSDLRLKAGLDELREIQKVTERKLQAFIDTMRRGGNGEPPPRAPE